MTEIRSSDVTDRDVYITRAFTAPRDVVWKFFTQPELIAQWFGPSGYSVPIETVAVDLELGGRWNLSMVDDATGDSYPIEGRITVCEPPEYLEIRLDAQTELGELDRITLRLQFHDHGEKTRVTLHQGPFDETARDQTAAGWELSFVKLDAALAGVTG